MAILDNIEGAWKLDESSGNAVDSSGNSRTLTNNNTVAYAAAKINNGADFSATNTNKSLSTTNGMNIDGGACSISIWVKLKAEIAANDWVFCSQSSTVTDTAYDIGYDYNGGTRRVYFQRSKPGVTATQVTSNLTMGTSDWHHLVLIYAVGGTCTGYVNGSSVGTFSQTGNGTANIATGFGVGFSNWNGGGSLYASALIDIVGIWSRELTSAEVTQLYNAGAGIQYPFVETDYVLSVDVGSYALTGNDIGLSTGYTISTDVGSYALTGNDVSFGFSGWLNPFTKHSASPSNLSKNTSNWTNRGKNQ